MRIINKTQKTILAEDVILANGLFKRMKGLLGRKEFKPGQALILRPCNSIHTFFMRFPIDVLFMDKNSRVIKAIHSLKPFSLTPIYFNAAFVIELPANTLKSTFTSQGDTLILEGKPEALAVTKSNFSFV